MLSMKEQKTTIKPEEGIPKETGTTTFIRVETRPSYEMIDPREKAEVNFVRDFVSTKQYPRGCVLTWDGLQNAYSYRLTPGEETTNTIIKRSCAKWENLNQNDRRKPLTACRFQLAKVMLLSSICEWEFLENVLARKVKEGDELTLEEIGILYNRLPGEGGVEVIMAESSGRWEKVKIGSGKEPKYKLVNYPDTTCLGVGIGKKSFRLGAIQRAVANPPVTLIRARGIISSSPIEIGVDKIELERLHPKTKNIIKTMLRESEEADKEIKVFSRAEFDIMARKINRMQDSANLEKSFIERRILIPVQTGYVLNPVVAKLYLEVK